MQVQLTPDGGALTPVINYTNIQFDQSSCFTQTTTTAMEQQGSMTTANGKQIMTNYVSTLSLRE